MRQSKISHKFFLLSDCKADQNSGRMLPGLKKVNVILHFKEKDEAGHLHSSFGVES